MITNEHWVTLKDGRKVLIKEDLIDKQYREIARQEEQARELNGLYKNYIPNDPYRADYTTEADTYGTREEQSKKAIKQVHDVIEDILKDAKDEGITEYRLEDYIWDKIHDAFSLSSPYNDGSKVMSNNKGNYDPDAMIDFVSIDIMSTPSGVKVALTGSSNYMSEFDDEDLEYMGIYKG